MKRGQWLGLRHVALNVADMGRAKRFYTDLFGLRVEWEPDPKNVYLTSGMDNLALHEVEPAGEGARNPLDHIGFVVGAPEDVDRWAERIEAWGAAVERPPRTHRDGARSLYFRDPDANLIQILYHPPLADLPGADDPSAEAAG